MSGRSRRKDMPEREEETCCVVQFWVPKMYSEVIDQKCPVGLCSGSGNLVKVLLDELSRTGSVR